MTKKKSKGFTITEIMVVIAIIGILVGIVVVALPKIRQSAKDARIKSDLLQIQNRAENIYLDEGNYDQVCCGCDDEITILCNDIVAQGGTAGILKLSPNAQKYCAVSKLNIKKNGADNYYCVNWEGKIIESTDTGVPGPLATDCCGGC